ncbi:small nuclear RNA activating complex, polypeptide 3 [Actinomortierella ambigua]|nr:small nuclear RNA activating complex, polypeptide 3 [Actinomortierella ambigua]
MSSKTAPRAPSIDKVRLDAVAARCDIHDEIESSNAPFSDPTLFGLLKEWHDFLVTKAHPHQEREEAARQVKGVRPSWKSTHGHPGEGSDNGISVGSRSGGNLGKTAGSDGNGMGGMEEGEEDEDNDSLRDGSVVAQTRRGPERRPVASRIFLNTAGRSASVSNDPAAESTAPGSSASTSKSTRTTKAPKSGSAPAKQQAPRVPPVASIRIIKEQNMQRLQRYLTPAPGEDTEDQPAFHKTTIETNIEKLLEGFASSPLATLNVDHRFEVPTSERPPLNFRNVYLPLSRYSRPYRAVTTHAQEVVLTVAIHSSSNPSRRTQEVKLLGSNTLLDLRNVLSCSSDFVIQGQDELPEDHPVQKHYRNTATSKSSNSMFYIEGCFYIDNPLLHAKADKKRALVEEERDRQVRLRHQIFLRRREAEQKRREQTSAARAASHASDDTSSNMETDGGTSEDLLDVDVSDLESELLNVVPGVDLPLEKMEVEYAKELEEVSEDYSAPILAWAKKHEDVFPPGIVPRKRIMAETTLENLDIRLHHPYLFVHQGHCEHLIYFMDMHAFNLRHDELNRNDYPITTFLSRSVGIRCRMCTTNNADYVTLDSSLAETNPCYFCQRCFNNFHYDQEGRPLFDESMRVFRSRPDFKEEVTSLAHEGELQLVNS